MTKIFLDVECYPNYFLVLLKKENGKVKYFELDEEKPLDINTLEHYLQTSETIGFNSRNYDIPMIMYALRGHSNKALKILSDRIVGKEESTYDILCSESLWCPGYYNHIDLIKVSPGVTASLKMYGARLQSEKLQDLPYVPDQDLTHEQKQQILAYCANDVDLTIDLYNALSKQLEIRNSITKEYKVDVRSKSDPQIAESLLRNKLSFVMDPISEYKFRYTKPDYVSFETPLFQKLLGEIESVEFVGNREEDINQDNIAQQIEYGLSCYSIGIGGLHSAEKNRAIITSSDGMLIDLDVVSYYPSIILNNEYYPRQLDKLEFLDLYRRIFNERIEAKQNGDRFKSQVFKIILNGSFGKFGDKFSKLLYDPEMLVHTTLTGQLSLLMLIEMLEQNRFNVVSANTDGIAVYFKAKHYAELQALINRWQKRTSLMLEETRYKAIYNESVNSYIAIKEDGTLKCKGHFVTGSLSNNAHVKVCTKAVIEYLTKGTAIEKTIGKAEKIPENFTMFIKVANGGIWKGKYLGRVVRWYWSKNGEPIYRQSETIELKKDGTPKKDVKVANSEGAYPLMDLSEPMQNLDTARYIAECYKMLKQIGLDVKQEKVAS